MLMSFYQACLRANYLNLVFSTGARPQCQGSPHKHKDYQSASAGQDTGAADDLTKLPSEHENNWLHTAAKAHSSTAGAAELCALGLYNMVISSNRKLKSTLKKKRSYL